MDKLIKKWKGLTGKIDTLHTIVNNHATAPLDEKDVQLYLGKVSEYHNKHDDIFDDILELCKDDVQIAAHQVTYNNYEAILHNIQKSLKIIADTFPATASTSSATTTLRTDVRLPKLEIPKFDGKIQDWSSFHDLFMTSVHSNTTLSGAQKLQHLKSLVVGEPSVLLNAVKITDCNYDEAWKILTSRYENKREIVKSHLDRLFSQGGLQQEDPIALRKLADTTGECVRALHIMKITPEQIGELIIIHVISRKLDAESRLEWEKTLKADEIPTFKNFMEFVENQVRVTLAAGISKSSKIYTPVKQEFRQIKKPTSVYFANTKSLCAICDKEHYITKCDVFLKFSPQERQKAAQKQSLCFNCLSKGHSSSKCRSSNCRKCDARHHTLLHFQKEVDAKFEEPKEISSPTQPQQPVVTLLSNEGRTSSHVMLSTALVKIQSSTGQYQTCRALLDMGSETSIITTNCVQKLGLKQKRVSVPILGIGSSDVGTATSVVSFYINSCINDSFSILVDSLVMTKVTGMQPKLRVNHKLWSHIHALPLADPKFYESSPIDILLGNDVFPELLLGRKVPGSDGAPTAVETELGWILCGKYDNKPAKSVSVHHANLDISATLQQFWELEEIPKTPPLSPEEILCEQHFVATHSRDKTGRYTVRLPFKANAKPLGESRKRAVQRLLQLERRFSTNPERQVEYNANLQDYLNRGHMELVPILEIGNPNYYMPHHAVYKESSTTQVRPVFDASAASSTGVALNDNLMVGPKLQQDLISILMRFRVNRIAFSADIAKMYRQFLVHQDDVDFQRIVWRKSSDEPIQDYRLLTATFGTSSAPYQAVKCVQQLAKDEQHDFPEASAILLRDLYVDDLMSGARTEDEAIALKDQVLQITKRGQLELRKWSSNSQKLLESLPEALRETNLPLRIDVDETVKALGMLWNPTFDVFSFTVKVPVLKGQPTKRIVASENAKIFDPLGLLSPVTVNAKLFLQKLWKINLDWDSPLPVEIQDSWIDYLRQLPSIQDIKIPRYLSSCNSAREMTFQLHGFCDASEEAYSAAVYLRTATDDDLIVVKLVAAKTKVKPLKQQTLPRLELCGALLLSRLMECVKDSLGLEIQDFYGWTDSTIVLAWLASPPQRWKTFVANRISEIQSVIPYEKWNHVRSEDNPADCASRGISPAQLADHPLWWNGPDWLTAQQVPNMKSIVPDASIDLTKEERKEKVVSCVLEINPALVFDYSSLPHLLRVTAYCFRFINNTLKQKDREKSKFVTLSERNAALDYWIKTVQETVFHREIHRLKSGKLLPRESKILSLSPFLDSFGLLRVGGRLKNSQCATDKKFPILLPKKHFLTDLIVSYFHVVNLHAGPQLLLACLQEKYWIVSGRDVVRLHVRKCVVCCRHRAQMSQQIMGDLPAARVTPGRPFLKCGVDYAGPFALSTTRGRGQKTSKGYICLFVCFATRAIHLELAMDMTSEAFIAALKRFVSKRGRCSDIFSDCGTNLVGADNELKILLEQAKSQDHDKKLSNFATEFGMKWHFNPPGAPHFNGISEAGVKSAKFHLKRVMGKSTYTVEEMTTTLAQIEACLNSRPITAMSSDPSDLSALTPGHFLIGEPLTAIPHPDLAHIPENRLSRWQKTQQVFQHFWKRWSSEYLLQMQQRAKWTSATENFKEGDLVLVKDDDLPPLKWNLGRIASVHPGKDNIVRAVTVKTETGNIQRPIVKLCKLPIE